MLEVKIQKHFHSFRLDTIFTVGDQLAVLFGPSAAGKSLTLQAIAGTVLPDTGRIVIGDQVVYDSARRISLPPQRRSIGYVPQHYALFPHLTAEENIGFGLVRLARRERQRRVAALIELFGLRGVERRRPHQLSGGQQQRVALARALAVQPRLLLLDEPFAALDVSLRGTLRQELVQVQARWGITVLMVTHDLDDVFALGQQVVVYDGGRVIQQGTRDEIFFRPISRRVAEFVQTGNILPAVVESTEPGTLWLHWQDKRIAAAPKPLAPGTPVYLCIRPTQILIVRPDRLAARQRENLLLGNIVRVEIHAEMYTLYLRLDNSGAEYDLEIVLPGYVYYRLALQTEKRLLVELGRQFIHVIPRMVEAEISASTMSGNSHAASNKERK